MIAKNKRLIPAAAYVRMSSGKQERSPAQQKAEIVKLAAREGCRIDFWFQDDAITGDSGPLERPDFNRMLEAAQQGKFERILAYDQDRIGRFDSIDAGQWMAPLRAAGVTIITCVQGTLDWNTFEGRIIYAINQEGKKKFLEELSGKVVRGKIANAKAGNCNGGLAPYAMDRGLFDAVGKLVRRLSAGEIVRIPGHRVRLVPSTDKNKVAAVRYAFQRFDEADIGLRQLARELDDKAFPSPVGKGWTHTNVLGLLTKPCYAGTARWGKTAWGKYHTCVGDDIVAVTSKRDGHDKQEEDMITVGRAHTGIIPVDLFKRVQKKLSKRENQRHFRRAEYPLTGLIFCSHCGKPMYGVSDVRADRKGKPAYCYSHYICSDYHKYGPHGGKCGHQVVNADQVLGWLVRTLQKAFLETGRAELVAEIKTRLEAEAKQPGADTGRLEKQLAKLDREISRLVKAIRMTDAPELVKELTDARREKEGVTGELGRCARFTDASDLDAEAERLADEVWNLKDAFTDSDPATLRELLRRVVNRIECRWEREKRGNRTRCKLVEGIVELRDCDLFRVCGAVATAT